MRKKINLQLMLTAALAIFATLLLVVGVYYQLFCEQVEEDLRTYTHVLKSTEVLDGLPEKRPDMRYDPKMDDLRITVIGEGGEVLLDSNASIGAMDNHAGRPEVAEAVESGEGSAVRRSDTLEHSTFYYAVRMDDGNILRVAKEANSILSVFASAFPAILAIAAVLLLVSMALAHFLTRSLVAPIRQMAGNMDNLDNIETYDELVPFITTIRSQHEDIMKNASMRQEFTANVSHELKTPLAAISGYAELIENGMASDGDVSRFAGEIRHNSNRLLTLINDVIRLSELDASGEEDSGEPLDLYEIAETCVSMLQMSAESHQVSLSLEGGSAILQADRQMMEELLYNLCDNAIRYNNKGGKVTVSVRKEGDKAKLTVKDTGIGIPKEHQERIFERFYRVDKSRSKLTGGTGLGLAIVKHIVAKQNAYIDLSSEPGKGTTVTVTFPAKEKSGL